MKPVDDDPLAAQARLLLDRLSRPTEFASSRRTACGRLGRTHAWNRCLLDQRMFGRLDSGFGATPAAA